MRPAPRKKEKKDLTGLFYQPTRLLETLRNFNALKIGPLWPPSSPLCQAARCGPAGRAHRSSTYRCIRDLWALAAYSIKHTQRGAARWQAPHAAGASYLHCILKQIPPTLHKKYTDAHRHINICTQTHAHRFIHTDSCTHTHAHKYMHMDTCAQIPAHRYMRTDTCTQTHAH